MRVSRIVTILAMACAGAACHAKRPAAAPAAPPPPAAVPARPAAPPAPPSPARPPAHAPTAEDLFERESLSDLNAQHPLGDAFFDYNQTDLRDDAKQALKQDADWLSKWPTTKVLVEGHCDERGTAEYNLALGDRRAQVVTDYLEALGVNSSRIVSDSVGKEKPFCDGDSESCWSQNRRGHFVITAK
jgi:peptidoglycan-associated lipoprotein